MNKTYRKADYWALALLLYPFVSTSLYGLFSQYIYLIRPHFLEHIIDRTADVITLPSVFAVFFALSAVIGAIVLIKARGKDLFALFLTAMGLLFLFTCLYLYIW